MHVYLTTGPTAQVFGNDPNKLPQFVWENITFGDWNDHRVVEYDINIPYVSISGFAFGWELMQPSLYNTTVPCGPTSSCAGTAQTQILHTPSLIGILFTITGNVRGVLLSLLSNRHSV